MTKLIKYIQEAKIIKTIWPSLLSLVYMTLRVFVMPSPTSWSYFLFGFSLAFVLATTFHIHLRHQLLKQYLKAMDDYHQESMGGIRKIQHAIGLRLLPGGNEENNEIGKSPTLH